MVFYKKTKDKMEQPVQVIDLNEAKNNKHKSELRAKQIALASCREAYEKDLNILKRYYFPRLVKIWAEIESLERNND